VYTLLPVVIDYELRQKSEEGCRVEQLRHTFENWLAQKGCEPIEVFYAIRDKKLELHESDVPFLEMLYAELLQLSSDLDDAAHPVEWTQLLSVVEAQAAKAATDVKANARVQERAHALATEGSSQQSQEQLYDRIYGGWLGRTAGCVLGKPVELWPHERVRSYLELTGSYPLTNYIPAMHPMPTGFKFKDEWKGATLGDIDGAPRDDDMDYPILNLGVLDRYGPDFTSEQVGEEWLRQMPYKLVYTAERVTYKNLINGMKPPLAGHYRNPYREWIGAQIRADLWGWVNPGRPIEAISMAYRDSRLSHTKNGLYGAMWISAMLAIAFDERDTETVVRKALQYIPNTSRLHAAIEQVTAIYRKHQHWEDGLRAVQEKFGAYNTVHTINNAAVVAMALLYSEGNFETGVTTAVMAGWDTDCNGATVGSVLGIMNGAQSLPDKWIAPLKDRINTLVLAERPLLLSELAHRTLAYAGRDIPEGGSLHECG